jgi:hypothetical protein
MLGALGGALAFGFMGVFIGPTLLAVAYTVLRDWTVGSLMVSSEMDAPLTSPDQNRGQAAEPSTGAAEADTDLPKPGI